MSKDRYSDNHTIDVLNNNALNISAHTTNVTGTNFEVNSTAGIHLTSATDYTVMDSNSTFIRANNVIQLEGDGGIVLQSGGASGYVAVTNTDQLVLAAEIFATIQAPNTEFISSGNITLDAGNNINIDADGNITLVTPDDLSLSGTSAVSIYTDLANPSWMTLRSYELELTSKKNLELICNSSDPNVDPDFGNIILTPHSNGAVEVEQGDLEVASGDVIVPLGEVKTRFLTSTNAGSGVYISADSINGSAVHIYNTAGNSNLKDGLWIDPNQSGTGPTNPGPSNNWITFAWNGFGNKGAIQGAGGLEVPVFGEYPAFVSTELPGVSDVFGSGRTQLGNAQFVSGNADFGEYFEAGDLSEWDAESTDRSILGVQEGTLVWVVGKKFYKSKKDGAGVPMLVTNRALTVGGGLPIVKGSGEKACGEVLSFCGVLPVIIEGGSSVGDLIFAADTGNHCISISKDNVTFRQYMDALGTVLESGPDIGILPDDHPTSPGEETRFHQRFCAIGVK